MRACPRTVATTVTHWRTANVSRSVDSDRLHGADEVVAALHVEAPHHRQRE